MFFKYQSILKLTDIKVGDKCSLELLRFLEKGWMIATEFNKKQFEWEYQLAMVFLFF